jgi:hypothetical protein
MLPRRCSLRPIIGERRFEGARGLRAGDLRLHYSQFRLRHVRVDACPLPLQDMVAGDGVRCLRQPH